MARGGAFLRNEGLPFHHLKDITATEKWNTTTGSEKSLAQ